MPAESYMPMSNQGHFEESGARPEALEEALKRTHADLCRPVVTGGEMLAFVRKKLIERAPAIGWTPQRDAELRLVVDGATLDSVKAAGTAVFLFPASATDVRLMSNTFKPSLWGERDSRTLGVALKDIVVSATRGDPRRIDLADPRLRAGVYGVETGGGGAFRWTNGEVVLDPQLWGGLSGTICLFVGYGDKAVRSWVAPARDIQEATSQIERKPKLYAVGKRGAARQDRKLGPVG